MGTELATDLVHNNHQDAEQKLWRHVILNALEDASVDLNDRKSAVNKFEAHNWIIKDKDFEKIICQLILQFCSSINLPLDPCRS